MNQFTFVALDARPAARAATLTWLAEHPALGVEVTIPELADACSWGNIDPQHGCQRRYVPVTTTGGTGGPPAAVDVALEYVGIVPSVALVTIRPDLDSVGAMALIVLQRLGLAPHRRGYDAGSQRADGYTPACNIDSPEHAAIRARIDMISRADSYRPGPWAPRQLPTVEQLFPVDESSEPADGRRSLAHLGAICSPRPGQVALPLEERVAIMACWLLWGDEVDSAANTETYLRIDEACGLSSSMPGVLSRGGTVGQELADARRTVEAARRALAEELAKPGAIENANGIAVVRVSHAGALGAGYCLAPVVVAFDQAVPGKVTIAAAEDGRADFTTLRNMLNTAEVRDGTGAPGWGGPRNLLGSPQGTGTRLSEERVLALVRLAAA